MEFEDLDVTPRDVRTGEHYRTYVVGNVSVAELGDPRIFEEEADAIREDFLDKLRTNPGVDATVDLVSMDQHAGDRLLDTVEQAVREGREHGLRKYAIVSDDIAKYAMKAKVDVDGVETLATDDPDEALDWARD
jgi:hypothetical protein